YGAAIFHLMTHAFFKALLFLAAGSVIIALHHQQDMRYMGGLKKYMPITYWTALIGSLALAGIPPFAGFFSKDAIIEAVGASHLAGSGFAYFAVLTGVFVTAFYSFRLLFLTFHGPERFRQHHHGHEEGAHHHATVEPKESPWVVTVPLILLAIPSVYAGWAYIEPLLVKGWFGSAIVVAPAHDTLGHLAANWHGVLSFITHGVMALPFWLAVAGIASAYLFYMVRKDLPERVSRKAGIVYTILLRKYGFDEFNDWFFAGGARKLGGRLWRWGDVTAIDGWLVNGSARLVGAVAGLVRQLQSGFIYHYAFAMIIGLVVLVTWFVQP
ncbi:MAG: proton-conducting transporter membrane subunit, partial [Pseudomonadota bacterium]